MLNNIKTFKYQTKPGSLMINQETVYSVFCRPLWDLKVGWVVLGMEHLTGMTYVDLVRGVQA